MNDLILLTNLIEQWVSRIREANALRQLMADEGRTTLTPEELAGLQADWDTARAELVAAIARAKSEGR